MTTPEQASQILRQITPVPDDKTWAQHLVSSISDQVEVLTKERDTLQYEVDAIPAIKAERDALMAAAKLAMDALTWRESADRLWVYGQDIKAMKALREAGVQ